MDENISLEPVSPLANHTREPRIRHKLSIENQPNSLDIKMTLTSYSSSGSISATNTFTAGLLLRAVGDGTTGSAQLGAVNNHIN